MTNDLPMTTGNDDGISFDKIEDAHLLSLMQIQSHLKIIDKNYNVFTSDMVSNE